MKTINFFKTALLTIALFVCGNVAAEIAYNANFTNQTGAAGTYSPNVTISLENQEWYASYCYFGSNEFRLGHNKNTGVVPSKFLPDQPQGASIEMLWDIENVTKISVSVGRSYGTLSDWYIFESTDQGNNWQQVATGEYAQGETWEYSTISPKPNARYAFVITGSSSPRVVLTTVTIEKEANSVSTPTFSILSGKYTEVQNVTIDCETAEASIYYTIDGTEPSAESTLYNGAINISSTTTLKAIAIKDGESSTVASATYTFPTEVANIAAYNALEKNTFTKITGDITVSFISGSNIYAQDETGAMLIYDYDYAQSEGLAAGATISNLIGTKSEYGGAAQMADVISSTIGEGTTILAPTTVTSVTTADLHKYVKLEDAQFDKSYSFTESQIINATLSTHDAIVVRNNFKNFAINVTAADKYDIIGFVNVYNDQVQIYPISIVVTTPSITLSTNSLAFETVENNQTKDLTFTVNGANLSEDATLAISGDNADYFTCTPTNITPSEDGSIAETTITVTYQPAAATGEHVATLTITCGDLVKEIALTGTCINPMLATPVATEATTITANGFTANWEAAENATSYDVNVWTSQEVLYETFDTQDGTGGNDGQWSGAVASNDVNGLADWTLENAYGAKECIKLGAGSKLGVATTPALNIEGNATLTFRAGAWDSKNENTTLLLSLEGTGTLSETEVTLAKGEFQEYTITLTGISANTKISFKGKQASNSRFFLDDIKVIGVTPIVGSPFIVTGSTNTAIINLTEETTYYYNVVAKADGYTASEASNTVEVKTLGEPTYAITGEGVTFDEATGYTLELGEVVLNDVAKEFTLTASNYNSSISLSSTRGLWKLAETAATGDLYTFTPDENGSINANLTVSFKTTEEMMGTTIEDLINYGMIAYGRPQTEQWAIIIDGEIDNYLYISFTPTEEGPVTGICDQPEMEGISFNGQEIINSLNLDVAVYNAIGQMVVRSNENINMSSYPAGVYVIKAANGESMKIVK